MILAVLLLGVAATAFPTTLLSASLDTIREDLDTSLSTVSWLQVAPALATAVSVPIFGKLCDLVGARRVYLWGIGLMAAFSFITAAAWDAGSLIAVRTIGQLVGGATGPAGYAVISARFTGGERSSAIAKLGMISALSPLVGLTFGGPLIEWLGWRMVFVAQGIPTAAGFLLAVRSMPDTARRPNVRFDVAGATLLAAAVAAGLFGLNRISQWGVGHTAIWACTAGFVVMLLGFVAVERHTPHPLLPLHYLQRREFTATVLTNFLILGSFMGASILVPLLLRRHYGYALTAVTYFSATRPIGYSLGARSVPILRARMGRFGTQLLATGLMTVMSVILAIIAGGQHIVLLVIILVVSGYANGVAFIAVITSINEMADPADVGVANGVLSMIGTIGGVTGITVVSAILGDSIATRDYVIAFAVLAVCSGLAVLSTLATSVKPRARSVDSRVHV